LTATAHPRTPASAATAAPIPRLPPLTMSVPNSVLDVIDG
jgi:hypothetical protein